MSSTLKWLWLIICPLFLGNTHQYDVAPIAIHSVLLWRAAEQADNCMCQIIQSLPAPPRPTILWLTLCTCVSLPLPVFWVLSYWSRVPLLSALTHSLCIILPVSRAVSACDSYVGNPFLSMDNHLTSMLGWKADIPMVTLFLEPSRGCSINEKVHSSTFQTKLEADEEDTCLQKTRKDWTWMSAWHYLTLVTVFQEPSQDPLKPAGWTEQT